MNTPTPRPLPEPAGSKETAPMSNADLEVRSTRIVNSVMEIINNPLNATVITFLSEYADETRRHAHNRLGVLLAAVAESKYVRSYCTAVYVVNRIKHKLTLVSGRYLGQEHHEISLDEDQIVTHVARTGRNHLSNDVSTDELYKSCFDGTQSELAVPVYNRNGDVIGVINFENINKNAYSEKSLETIERSLPAFRKHLEVLYSTVNNPGSCPWHPALHGWNFPRVMKRLCHAICSTLGSGTTTCTAWYCDGSKNAAFAFATCGYDSEYTRFKTLEHHMSKVGEVFEGHESGTVNFSPISDPAFSEKKKAKDMGIDEGYMIRIPFENSESGFVLAVYTKSLKNPIQDRSRKSVILTGLPLIVERIRDIANEFCKKRQEYISGLIADEARSSGASAFGRVLPKLTKAMGAQAGSIFGRVEYSEVLECLATTGFVVPPPSQQIDLIGESGHCYHVKRHRDSFTVLASENPWQPVRMNDASDPVENGLPDWLPKRKVPKAVLKEAIRGCAPKHRRILLVGFEAPDGSRGVIRLIRSMSSCPFVLGDEDLIRKIAMQLAIVLHKWSQAVTSEKSNEHPVFRFISQPTVRDMRFS